VNLTPDKPALGYAERSATHDCCLEPGKIDALKMLDSQTKSAMKLV